MKVNLCAIDKQIEIIPRGDRWYEIPFDFIVHVYTDCGHYTISVAKGFMFDGRSGGPLCDFIVPNLGTQPILKCWLIHDIMAYDIGFSFKETNQILHDNLIRAGVGSFKAWTVQSAVSLSDGWFGEPKPGDREMCNMGKIHVRLNAK